MTEKASSNDCESAPRSAIKLRENTAQEPRCQQLAASANSRIKHPQFENCTVGYMLDPQRARNEKQAVADIVRLAGANVYTAEVERPVERGGQKGGGRDFERDGERMWQWEWKRKGGRRRV